MYDLDHNDYIDEKEMKKVLKVCIIQSFMKMQVIKIAIFL